MTHAEQASYLIERRLGGRDRHERHAARREALRDFRRASRKETRERRAHAFVLNLQFDLQLSFAHHERAMRGHVLPQRIVDQRGHHIVVRRELAQQLLRTLARTREIARNAHEVIVRAECLCRAPRSASIRFL